MCKDQRYNPIVSTIQKICSLIIFVSSPIADEHAAIHRMYVDWQWTAAHISMFHFLWRFRSPQIVLSYNEQNEQAHPSVAQLVQCHWSCHQLHQRLSICYPNKKSLVTVNLFFCGHPWVIILQQYVVSSYLRSLHFSQAKNLLAEIAKVVPWQ